MGNKFTTSHMPILPLPPPQPPPPQPQAAAAPRMAVAPQAKMAIPPPGLPRLEDWEDHPAWSTGMQFLEAYHHWVEDIVMPIAFQWIYEHYDYIYQENPEGWGKAKLELPDYLQDPNLKVSRENSDDVGVVIARAFAIVRELDAYKIALEKFENEFEPTRLAGGIDSDGNMRGKGVRLNPVWTDMTHRIRESTEQIFKEQKGVLDDTAFPDDYS